MIVSLISRGHTDSAAQNSIVFHDSAQLSFRIEQVLAITERGEIFSLTVRKASPTSGTNSFTLVNSKINQSNCVHHVVKFFNDNVVIRCIRKKSPMITINFSVKLLLNDLMTNGEFHCVN